MGPPRKGQVTPLPIQWTSMGRSTVLDLDRGPGRLRFQVRDKKDRTGTSHGPSDPVLLLWSSV